jgi:cell division protein FtsQ
MTLWMANMLYALAAVLLLYGVLFLVIHLPLFPLRQVDIKGDLHHVNREQVQFIVQRELKGNFFTFNINGVRAAFEKLPWVRSASVRRRWPDRLEVTLEEHRVLARWGGTALVNMQGEVFQAASDAVLPEFIGPPDSAREITDHYLTFSRMLVPLNLVPTRVVLSPRRALQLRLNNGLVLELGREQVEQRLAKFVRVYDQTILRLPQPPSYVDLRYPNGFAVRLPAGTTLPAAGQRAASEGGLMPARGMDAPKGVGKKIGWQAAYRAAAV